MGPRSFNRGKVHLHDQTAGRTAASMGPRSFNRGKLILLIGTKKILAQLQWGLGLSTEERRGHQLFLQVQHKLQWGLGLSTEESRGGVA